MLKEPYRYTGLKNGKEKFNINDKYSKGNEKKYTLKK